MAVIFSDIRLWHFLLFLCCICISMETVSAGIIGDPCSGVKCKAGRVCKFQPGGIGACECIQKCPDYKHPICGSNGMTYQNHCELHKAACLTGRFISMRHKGNCNQPVTMTRINASWPASTELTKQAMPRPVACLMRERDILRTRLISSLKSELESPNGMQRATTYDGATWVKFYECDSNRDAYLDADEFLDCVKSNLNISELPYGEQTELMRALCVDAIIDIGDHDRDWKLSYQEFRNTIDYNFKPAVKNCHLEDKEFPDGLETSVDCNQCVCACGHWVCTSVFCDHHPSASNAFLN